MATLSDTFQTYETGMILIIAEQWGIEDSLNPKKNRTTQLVKALTDQDLFYEIIDALPISDQLALKSIINNGGRTPAAQFFREFGQIREMGALSIEKTRPDRNPLSTSENLFYKGLIGRSFFNSNGDTVEFVFIPDEFDQFLRSVDADSKNFALFPHIYKKTVPITHSCSDDIVDQIALLLAAQRGNLGNNEIGNLIEKDIHMFILELLQTIGVIDKKRTIINPEILKALLTTERCTLFSKLCFAWMDSGIINELHLLPTLFFEGKWKNNPIKTRGKVLDIIAGLPDGKWVQIKDFVSWMHHTHPDFQRTAGEYETWFIKDSESGEYLEGFESWEHVDGALLSYFINGPFYWMGILDLGWKKGENPPFAFRTSSYAKQLLLRETLSYESKTTDAFTLYKNGEILLKRGTQRGLLYQIARFCEWKENKGKTTHFLLGSSSLERAKSQAISTGQIKNLILSHAKKPIPENILKAIERWETKNSTIIIEPQMLLRVPTKEILDRLIDSRAKQYIIEQLNDTHAIVRVKDIHRLRETLIEMGYFSGSIGEV